MFYAYICIVPFIWSIMMIVYLVLFLLLLMDINRSHCPTGINPHTLVYFLLDELHFFSHSKLQENVVVVVFAFCHSQMPLNIHRRSFSIFIWNRLFYQKITRKPYYTMYTVYNVHSVYTACCSNSSLATMRPNTRFWLMQLLPVLPPTRRKGPLIH